MSDFTDWHYIQAQQWRDKHNLPKLSDVEAATRHFNPQWYWRHGMKTIPEIVDAITVTTPLKGYDVQVALLTAATQMKNTGMTEELIERLLGDIFHATIMAVANE